MVVVGGGGGGDRKCGVGWPLPLGLGDRREDIVFGGGCPATLEH